MKHPLATQSLAPQGFVFPFYKQRLPFRLENNPHWVNPEVLIGRYWEKLHRLDAPHPFPMHTILHTILPKISKARAPQDGDFHFDGVLYRSREVCLVSSIVQWFATNVGNAFIETSKPEPTGKDSTPTYSDTYAAKYGKNTANMLQYWTHSCSPECFAKQLYNQFQDPHVYDHRSITRRDEAVAKAVMKWLDTEDGRAFVREWLRLRIRAYEIVEKRWGYLHKLKKLREKMAAAA